MLDQWLLDPTITYLNHGTVGAVPRPVLAAQQAIRDEMERQPSRFLLREVYPLAGSARRQPTRMREAAAIVADFLGARGDDLVFVDNATAGVNAVLRSLEFSRGDEILVTDQSYPTTARLAAFVADRFGAEVRTVRVPYPRFDAGQLVSEFTRALTPRTRLAVLDHVTSESALVFPLAELAAVCREHDVRVLADAAHAPGMLRVDIPALGVDWYAGNLHKWAFAPRSCGILWAHPDRQDVLHPPVISWGLGSGFTAEFDWVGTRDPSPWLAAPAGLAFAAALGENAVRTYNHDLAWRAARELTARWNTPLERDEASVGSMATIPLPRSLGSTGEDAAALRDALLEEDRIEIQTYAGHGRLWTRLSAQVYNGWEDMDRLGDVIERRANSRAPTPQPATSSSQRPAPRRPAETPDDRS
jgi:isopenicillin-N epimerase